MIFYHYVFHVRDRCRTPHLILHTILDVYPHINLINKELKFFRNYVCYENLNKSFCLVLKVFNKVINCIVLILINIYLFSCININTIYCVWCSVFGSHQSFEEKILLQICLQYTLHIWVLQRKLRLIIYSILYVYSHITFINK